ncbi:acetylornithine deacetylase [Ignicoccus pacificus DSM 13166]|uniref:Acetylornithine deacetylase n=1 Tax=Ignicoccus pacificus DSM 13166 TaxID=940294 RepID=A0A977PKE5_9CREN|nr:acetylornithine deacetylase [Ignicoccus pacificus DSM 13166]
MDPVELLKEMIKFKTVSLKENTEEVKEYAPEFKRFAEFMKGILEKCADEVKVYKVDDEYRKERCRADYDRYIIIARKGDPKLEFNGHYDVVPPGTGWKRDPFDPWIEGNKLYGRGAVDMKGGLASMTSAFCELDDVQLVAVPDEEIGGACGTEYRVNVLSKDFPIPKYVIIGEPSNLEIDIGHKGAVWAWARFRGKQAHASAPWLGENAFVKAAKALPLIEEELKNAFSMVYSKYEYAMGHPLAKTITVNFGGIVRVGTSNFNSVPGEAEFSIDLRLIPEVEAEQAREVLRRAVEKAGGEYVEAMAMDGYVVSEDSKIVKVLEETLKEMELPVKKVVLSGGTDQRFYGTAGSDAVVIGPGHLEVAHTPNEWVPIDHLYKAKEIYVRAVKKL